MASQTSPPNMLKLKAFKDELYAILDNVLDQAETLQTTAVDPVILDREWILEKLRDQTTTKEYVLEPRAMQVARGLGHLIKLPQELRDIIYSHAMANGTTALLLASTQTYKEASKLLFSKGVYRLVLGFGDRIINPPLSKTLAGKIQNLSIRANCRSFIIHGIDEHLPTIHLFDGSNVERKNCAVIFEWDPFGISLCAPEVVLALRNLTGFERIIVEQDLDWPGEPWPGSLYEFHKEQIWGRMDDAFVHCKKVLEPTLGEGDYGYDGEGLRLAFRPRG